MHILFKRKIFRSRESHTRCGNTLDGGIVCKVDKHHRALDCASLSEIADEKVRFFKSDAHRGKNHRELCVASDDFRLSCDLRRKLGVGHTRHREHGQFLTAHESVQTVDCTDARLNELVGIIARNGIDGLSVYVKFHFGDDGRAAVTRSAHTVENSSEHILAHTEFDAVSQKSGF